MVKFSIADQRPKDKEGHEQTQWFNCRAFDRTAELIQEYFGKGKPIWVQGILSARLYERRDGGTGMALDVQVTAFDFVPFGTPPRKEADPADPTPPPAPTAPRFTPGAVQAAAHAAGVPAPTTATAALPPLEDIPDVDIPDDIPNPFADQ